MTNSYIAINSHSHLEEVGRAGKSMCPLNITGPVICPFAPIKGSKGWQVRLWAKEVLREMDLIRRWQGRAGPDRLASTRIRREGEAMLPSKLRGRIRTTSDALCHALGAVSYFCG